MWTVVDLACDSFKPASCFLRRYSSHRCWAVADIAASRKAETIFYFVSILTHYFEGPLFPRLPLQLVWVRFRLELVDFRNSGPCTILFSAIENLRAFNYKGPIAKLGRNGLK